MSIPLVAQGVGLTDGHLHRLVEIWIEAERHVMRRVLGAWCGQLHALVNDEFHDHGVCGLDGTDSHLAIALSGVRIAGEEQAAGMVDRQEERGAGDEFLAIEIAAKCSRRAAFAVRTFLIAAGSTPITPMNGPSGTSTPGWKMPTLRARSSRTIWETGLP